MSIYNFTFRTIVHQTLKDKNNPDEVETDGPFPDNSKTAYLGFGCYFWDNNIGLAHWWGGKRNPNNYMIAEGHLQIDKHFFLDLVGSREDQILFKNLIESSGWKNLTIGTLIERFKKMETGPKKGIFPYKVIRAVDNLDRFNHEKIKFADNKQGFTNLNPHYIICLVKKEPSIVKNFKVIYPDKYKEA